MFGFKQRIDEHKIIFFPLLSVLLILAMTACRTAESKENISSSSASVDKEFGDYWYQGKAELTRYALEQARYGEIHRGDAVLIFVTEDFLTDKQVKYEFGDRDNAVSVLKLNWTRRFNTGIYPYSMMTSIFTPVEMTQWAHSLKVTTSSQEWCGHTFSQLNYRDKKFEGLLRSYFQAEGDQSFKLKAVLLEDEIWTRIRLSPQSLPTGEIDIIPATQFLRLRHQNFKVHKALAKMVVQDDLQIYTLDYKELERRFIIKFERTFPYEIVGWEERYASGWGAGKNILTTKAVKTHSIMLDYWDKNAVADSTYRKQLGLD